MRRSDQVTDQQGGSSQGSSRDRKAYLKQYHQANKEWKNAQSLEYWFANREYLQQKRREREKRDRHIIRLARKMDISIPAAQNILKKLDQRRCKRGS